MTSVRTISASEFKAKCLDLLDHVPPDGLAITKRGKTVARLFPERADAMRFYGSIPDAVISGDILSTGVKWDAES
jgi:antitoxin (DNA-binding transcriptional repressor) of toxin-antitoxin stability system